MKALVDAAHERGLMVLLDVVYNHFGPEGNYLPLYAPDFFHPETCTPWGAAIAYEKKPVRDFFIENALYWLEEYRFDGLRLDAIDQIDRQSGDFLPELASAVQARFADRHVHLTTEDDRNVTGLHERDEAGRPKLYSAEWNDDFHHAAHSSRRARRSATTPTMPTGPPNTWRARSPAASSIRANRHPIATDSCAANRARICRPPPSSTSCRTTTRSATAPTASG